MLLAIAIVAWLVLFVFALRGARWAYAVFIILAFGDAQKLAPEHKPKITALRKLLAGPASE